MIVLGIETSCDDTSAAVIDEAQVLSSVVVNQDNEHRVFGGVVPEVASRNHSERMLRVIDKSLADAALGWEKIEAIAVTGRPGLVGSLLVGLVTAKTLAAVKSLPLIVVNHLEGHLLAPLLTDAKYSPNPEFTFPALALVVSGGHTHMFRVPKIGEYVLVGQTFDDAAGEAFDKFAKLIGLGFPGGQRLDELAKSGNLKAFAFPRPMMQEEHFNFSFSGLKTAGQRQWLGMPTMERESRSGDLCASYQEAIVDVLVDKLSRAARHFAIQNLIITGGVSANSRLRTVAEQASKIKKFNLLIPPPRFCTDNAAMIALAGLYRLKRGELSAMDVGPSPVSLPSDFKIAEAVL